MIIKDYETLKKLLSLYANVDDIFATDYINPQVLYCEIRQLELKHQDDHYNYYAMVSDKPMTIKSREGKVWNIPANMVNSKTTILSEVSTDTLKDYSGRAKKLLRASKVVIKALNDYFNQFYLGQQHTQEEKWEI